MNEVKKLVEELRNKKSRDNRDLLDRSADMIERLAIDLCEKSGCHHKCHDTKDCVVEDEALLLINENKSNNSDFKSNNFDVKSNGELFKQALVEGLNRRFDREIEEAKKIEQIEEMARDICKLGISCEECTMLARKTNQTREQYCKAFEYAKRAYNAGYRKQEWISVEDRLPEDYNKYLLLLDNGRITIGWYHECAMQFIEDGIVVVNRVTHWMPLPEAPKMKGGK